MQGGRAQSRGPCCTGEEQRGGVLPRPCRKGLGWGLQVWAGGLRTGASAAAQHTAAQNAGIHQEVPRGETTREAGTKQE